MVKDTKDFITIDLTGIIKSILKRAWFIILCAVLLGGAGAGYAMTIKETPLYKSTAKLYITGSYTATLSTTTINNGQVFMTSYSNIMESRPVLATVMETLGIDISYNQLRNCISKNVTAGTCMMTIGLSYPDPEWAQAILEVLIDVSADYAYEIMGMAPPVVYENATLPTSPYNLSSKVKRYGAYGALAGGAIAFIIVLILAITDDKLRTPKNVEWKTDLEVKGIAPKGKKGMLSEHSKKAMRYLYSELWSTEKEPKIVSFISEKDAEKKDVINQLSTFLSGLGKEVAVLDTNMLEERLQQEEASTSEEESEGKKDNKDEDARKFLEDYLNGETDSIDDIVLFRGNIGYIRNQKEVFNSYELLKSDKCKELFEKLRERFDCVIVDTVCFKDANDAEAILDKADANLLVVTQAKTSGKQAEKLTKRIGKENFFGAVLAGVKVSKSGKFKKMYGKYVGLTVKRGKKK